MDERIKIYSYGKVWKIERKIYSFGNIRLPLAINPNDAVCFLGALIAVGMLMKIIPPFAALPAIVRYVIIPMFLTKYLMKKKLDGKNPIMYLAGILRYWLMESNTYLESFRRYRDGEQRIGQDWRCSWRRNSMREKKEE